MGASAGNLREAPQIQREGYRNLARPAYRLQDKSPTAGFLTPRGAGLSSVKMPRPAQKSAWTGKAFTTLASVIRELGQRRRQPPPRP